MARLLVVAAAAVVLCAGFAAGAAANDGCRDVITGYSGTFGKRIDGGVERFSNQTGQWKTKGAITKLNLYYNPATKCVEGVKPTYGYSSQDARLLGQERGLSTKDLTLGAGEHFAKAQVKAGSCVAFLRLVTNKGRVLELGDASSTLQLITSYPNKPDTGFLAAVRGYEEYTKVAQGTTRGPLKTIQLVWANCVPLGTGQLPKPATGGAGGATGDLTGSVSANPTNGPAETAGAGAGASSGAGAGGAGEGAGAAGEAAGDVGVLSEVQAACPSQVDMCAHEAGPTSAAYCPTVGPFKSATCMGGCCVSSGKCTSSSCAISGIGKEVPNTICYGLNPAIAIGASPNCRGLACKLHVPGCTSDLLGGSCAGTVVDLSGKAAAGNPAGAALVGYPCLDVTPSDKTLTADGRLSSGGAYVAKLWSICDCQAPATIGSTNIAVPHLGKLNLTDIKSLVEALKPNGTHGIQSVVDGLKAKLPPLIVPNGANPINLTNALGLIGSLVNKGGGGGGGDGAAGSGLSAFSDLVKGASALAAAANSSNPLGSLLGALAPPGPNGEKNPLAGLGNLVSALAGHGADTTEKADVLNGLLSSLSGGTSAAPGADLLGSVSKLLSASGGPDSPGANVAGLLQHLQGDKGELVKAIGDAVVTGKKAVEDGKIDLQGLLSKAQQFVGNDGSVDGAGNPTVSAILSGIQQLVNPHGATGDASNPLSFLAGLKNGSGPGGMSLQSVLDAAAKAGPYLQQLASGDASAAGPLAGLVKAVQGGEGGEGVDAKSVLNLAGKLGPVLQALGANSGADGSGQVNLKALAEKAGPVLQALTKASGGADGNAPLSGLQAFLDKMPHLDKAAAPAGVPAPGTVAAASVPAAKGAPS